MIPTGTFGHDRLAGLAGVIIAWAMVGPAPAHAAIKVFLLGGQSNMVGLAPSSGLGAPLADPQSDVPIFWNGAWRDLAPGFGSAGDRFGPEVSFGRTIKDALPDDDIALVKYAVGGTNLADQWRPPSSPPYSPRGGGRGGGRGGSDPPPGPLYQNFINTVTAAIDSIETLGLGEDYEFAGMIWMQGESDSQVLAMTELYEENLTNLIADVRNEVGAPEMPFVIGQISLAAAWTYGDMVRQAELDVAAAVPNTAVFDTADLSLLSDAIHYDTRGTVTLGERFAQSMLTFVPAPGSLIFLLGGWGAINRRRRRPPLRHNPIRRSAGARRRPPQPATQPRHWRRLAELA